MGKFIDLTGQKFGRLTVIYRVENDKIRHARWHCKCECGSETVARASDLKNGHTKSCGCLSREEVMKVRTKHGLSQTRLYNIFRHMKQRCYNPNEKRYNDYGGRGITICDEWLQDINSFYDWAIAHGYADNLTIDRIDNNKGYSPDNCRWATIQQQADNRRCVKPFTYQGVTYKSISEASKQLGIRYSELYLLKKKSNEK